MSHVRDYEEYKIFLRLEFQGINELPSICEVSSFIKKQNLEHDWDIKNKDVLQDIRNLIIDKGNRHIASYEEYLITLKAYFGIPSRLPEKNEIDEFIEMYSLDSDWGISSKEIIADLNSFMNSQYKNMLVDFRPKTERSPRYTYRPTSGLQSTQSRSGYSYSPNSTSYLYRKESVNSKKVSSTSKGTCKSKTPKSEQKQKNVEVSIIFYIDGDNHINEGQKGIEHTKKNQKVKVYFAQKGAKKNFDKKHKGRSNVSSKLVKPGNQAVDNQIKTDIGMELKKGNQFIAIISQDKGYDKFIEKNNKGNNKIIREESVSKVLKNK